MPAKRKADFEVPKVLAGVIADCQNHAAFKHAYQKDEHAQKIRLSLARCHADLITELNQLPADKLPDAFAKLFEAMKHAKGFSNCVFFAYDEFVKICLEIAQGKNDPKLNNILLRAYCQQIYHGANYALQHNNTLLNSHILAACDALTNLLKTHAKSETIIFLKQAKDALMQTLSCLNNSVFGLEVIPEYERQKISWMLIYNNVDFRALINYRGRITNAADFISAALTDDRERQQAIETYLHNRLRTDLQITAPALADQVTHYMHSPKFQALSLFDYQNQVFQDFHALLKSGKRSGFFTMATGLGKTRTFIAMLLACNLPKALIVLPTTILMTQTMQSMISVYAATNPGEKLDIGVYQSGRKLQQVNLITYSGLRLRINEYGKDRKLDLSAIPLIILDEAHHALANSVAGALAAITQSQERYVFACTATPSFNTVRSRNALRSLDELFSCEAFANYPLEKQIEAGRLAPIHVSFITPSQALIAEVHAALDIKTTADPAEADPSIEAKADEADDSGEIQDEEDYNTIKLSKALNNPKVTRIILDHYLNTVYPGSGERILGKTAMVFCGTIDHATAVAAELNAGLKKYYASIASSPEAAQKASEKDYAGVISGRMKADEKTKMIERYTSGDIAILTTAKMGKEGLDCPRLEVIYALMPTRSQITLLQGGGRVVRKDPKNPNKVGIIVEFNLHDQQMTMLNYTSNRNVVLGNNAEFVPHAGCENYLTVSPHKEVPPASGEWLDACYNWQLTYVGNPIGRTNVTEAVPQQPMLQPQVNPRLFAPLANSILAMAAEIPTTIQNTTFTRAEASLVRKCTKREFENLCIIRGWDQQRIAAARNNRALYIENLRQFDVEILFQTEFKQFSQERVAEILQQLSQPSTMPPRKPRGGRPAKNAKVHSDSALAQATFFSARTQAPSLPAQTQSSFFAAQAQEDLFASLAEPMDCDTPFNPPPAPLAPTQTYDYDMGFFASALTDHAANPPQQTQTADRIFTDAELDEMMKFLT